MSETPRLVIGQSGIDAELKEIEEDTEKTFRESLAPLAEEMKELFSEVRESIIGDLRQASQDGKVTIDELVDSITNQLSAAAIKRFVTDPVEGIVNQSLGDILGVGGESENTLNRSHGQMAAMIAQNLSRGGRNG